MFWQGYASEHNVLKPSPQIEAQSQNEAPDLKHMLDILASQLLP